MESGDLHENFEDIKRGLSEQDKEQAVANLIHQVILAIAFLHSQKCTHRDIKPGNVLVKY